jgi:gamma-glutamyltranspeptidase / glutathione hydrolase
VQPDLAATLDLLAEEGPDALYRGRLAEAIATTLQARGSTMTVEDLAAHQVDDPPP